MHPEDFTFGRAKIAVSFHRRVRHYFATGRTRLKADEYNVLAALGLKRPPSLPVRKNMKRPSHKVSPGSKDSGDCHQQHETRRQDQRNLEQAAQTAATPSASTGERRRIRSAKGRESGHR